MLPQSTQELSQAASMEVELQEVQVAADPRQVLQLALHATHLFRVVSTVKPLPRHAVQEPFEADTYWPDTQLVQVVDVPAHVLQLLLHREHCAAPKTKVSRGCTPQSTQDWLKSATLSGAVQEVHEVAEPAQVRQFWWHRVHFWVVGSTK